MLLFSVLSFAVALGVFYLWLLLLSCVNAQVPDADPVQRLVRVWLGRLERWPGAIKLLLPLAVTALAWCLLHPLLARLNMVPASAPGRLLAQGAVIGLAAYLTLKFLIIAILIIVPAQQLRLSGRIRLVEFCRCDDAAAFASVAKAAPAREENRFCPGSLHYSGDAGGRIRPARTDPSLSKIIVAAR